MSDHVVVIHTGDTPITNATAPTSLVVAAEPAETLVIAPPAGAVIVAAPGRSTLTVREQTPTVLAIASPAQGPPGSATGLNGQPRYSGQGEPGVIIGANPGDCYLDLASLDVYILE